MRSLPDDIGRHPAVLAAVTTVVGVLLLTVVAVTPAWAADPGRDRQWALEVVDADTAHAVGRGAGIVIAVVDSGVDLAHEDLAASIVAGRDFVDGDDRPQDEFGHGTHVAGIAAAVGDNGRGVVGAAPGASIMPVRVLDEEGRGSSQDVNDGIRWAVDNGADVVNLSLGETAQGLLGSSLTDAVRYAWERGVVVVVAAGNEFVLSSGFSDEPALVVSATTRQDRKPDYSNGVGEARWGMAAPGGGCGLLEGCRREDDVLSTYLVEGEQDGYAYLQGTSMAAPHVAGAAAVLRGLGLGPRQTVDRLLSTAEDVGPDGHDRTFGEGRLDMAAAVAGLGSSAAPPAADPTPTAAASPSPDPTTTTAPQDTSSPASPPAPAPSPQGQPGADVTAAPTPTPAPSSSPSPSSGPSPSTPGPGPIGDAMAGAPAGGERSDRPVAVIGLVLLLLAGGGTAWVARR